MDDRQEDVIDHIISFLSKQVQIKELISRLAPPYYPEPYPQQFYYPSTLGQFVQRSTNFSTSSFNQSSLTVPASTITISGSASTKNDKNLSEGETNIIPKSQLISLRGSICDKCLTVYTIPSYLYEDGTLNEIHNHSCMEDRLLDLRRRYKHDLHRFFVLLHRVLPKIMAAKVLICNKSQSKIYLWSMKCDGFLSSSSHMDVYNIGNLTCPIKFLDTFPSENRWLNQIRSNRKREDIIELERKEELLSFLEISIDSTMVILKVKHDSSLSPSENWDSYLVGLNLPEPNLERVTKPFAPKLRNWKYL